MKIHSVGAKSLHADGQTDEQTIIDNFANVPKVALLHVMKPSRGSKNRDRPALKQGTQMEVSSQSHALATLLPVPNEQKAEYSPVPVVTS
jgi:hypothetical protein